ncbi:MAG: hypothetical protein ACI4EN_06785 [Butyrivibrio sp.]
MYQCPDCGGGLRYDIPSQQLKCDYCSRLVDPYSLDDDIGGAKDSFYDVTVFTCPHCGGEIIGPENSAAEFCSYCGASTVLSSRISKAKRPNYIIPFRQTKDDCKEAFKKFIGRSFFTPGKFKNPQYIDSFRGIYMPYWTYYIEQKSFTFLKGEESHRSGDYIITNHFNLHFNADAYYKGLSYDASSSFYDSISSSIAPFDVKGMRTFHPAVLSGFYADIADIDSNVYADDAMMYANESTFSKVRTSPEFFGITIDEPTDLTQQNRALYTTCKETDSTMFPVWFMSYRKGNRVAYATVNGQTGKVAADFPVSVGKYLLCSLLIALPIFLLFTLLLNPTAPFTMTVACVLSLVSSIIYATEISAIAKKDSMVEDKGVMYKKYKAVRGFTDSGKPKKTTKKKTSSGGKAFTIIFFIIWAVMFVLPMVIVLLNSPEVMSKASPLFISILLAGTIITTCIGNHSAKKHNMKAKSPGFALSIITLSLSFIVALFKPASDLFYYGAVMFSLIMIVLLNIEIIRKYNILATRRLPQFDRKGGDDRA